MEASNSNKQGNEDEVEVGFALLRRRSLDLETQPRDIEAIRKTKSLNNQFLDNVDQLMKNVSRRFNNISFHYSNYFNFPFALHGGSCPEISDGSSTDPPRNGSDNELSSDKSGHVNEPVATSLSISLRFVDVKFKVTVNYGLNNSEGEKYLLHGVSGAAHPGELLAMIGPSGGGKTTLLNLLSGRVSFNSGTITYNNQPYAKSLKSKIGYVMQEDVLFPHLTVKETLTYSALLRLPNNLTKEQKRDRAMKVMIELGLIRCQDFTIGGVGLPKGISGGEKRRVHIGNEILLNPPLLLLDEPTTSLDSASALRIVQILQNMAKEGRTIVTTIHQPSSRIYSMFDKLILLGKGSSLYFGKASEAMDYFSAIGCSPQIPMNPAEFLLDVANGNMNDKSLPSELEDKISPTNARERPSPFEIHEYFVEACESRCCMIRKEKVSKPTAQLNMIKQEHMTVSSAEWQASWWDQFHVLLSRGVQERRHEYFKSTRVIQVISIAIIIGLLWWHPNHSSTPEIQEQAGLLFFISVFWCFFPLFTALFTFPQERAMLIKERSSGMYKLSAYFAARSITDIPLDLTLPIFFMLIVYFMVGMKASFPAFLLTLLTVFFSIISAQGLGLCIGAAFMDIKKAVTIASIIIMSFMLSGGFFIQDVPSFMSWVRYASFNYHTFRLLLKIQYGCSDTSSNPESCEAPIIKGTKVDYPGLIEVGALMSMIVGYRLLAYLLLRRMKYKGI